MCIEQEIALGNNHSKKKDINKNTLYTSEYDEDKERWNIIWRQTLG